MSNFWALMEDVIPNDHARQVTSEYYAQEVVEQADPPWILDLGSGSGASAKLFQRIAPQAHWVGIDIESSPEVDHRPHAGSVQVTYDGVSLPFRDGSVPLIYSHQVFEHVLHPRELISEISRVLSIDGYFVGSTSQFEPYHTFSVWNYTVYGFRVLVEEAGMTMEEVRPGIDGVTLIQRTYRGRPPDMSRFFLEESPLNIEIDRVMAERKARPALVNSRKLQFCGQFAFKISSRAR